MRVLYVRSLVLLLFSRYVKRHAKEVVKSTFYAKTSSVLLLLSSMTIFLVYRVLASSLPCGEYTCIVVGVVDLCLSC